MATIETQTLTNERLIDTLRGRVFVRETPGEDPPFVLLHGYPDDHRIYDKLVPSLAPRRAVAFDFLGYGRSDRPDDPGFSVEEHEAQITAVLDELGIERAVLVGQDASGPDAVTYAITRPDRVAGLVLLNTMFGHQPSFRMPEMTRLFADPQLTTLADDMVNDPGQLLWLLQRWGAQWNLDADDATGVSNNSILPQFFGDEAQPDSLTSIRAWCALLHPALDAQDALIDSGALGRIDAPVWVIFGRDDPYLNSSLALEIAALFDDPSVQLIEKAGHYPQHDQPEAVAEQLTRG